jgi:hypothetical protein
MVSIYAELAKVAWQVITVAVASCFAGHLFFPGASKIVLRHLFFKLLPQNFFASMAFFSITSLKLLFYLFSGASLKLAVSGSKTGNC